MSDDHLLLIGSALSARAAARLARAKGWRVGLVDDRPLTAEVEAELHALGVETRAADAGSALAGNVSLLVPSPAVRMDHGVIQTARRQGIPVESEISFARRWVTCPLAGITGSNGKTTTTALTAALLKAGGLKAEAGGNIGVPLADLALQADDWQALALELSSYQLETTHDLGVDAAVFLNLSEDHLARHGSLEAYGEAKFRLAAQLAPGGVVIHGRDDVFFAPRVRQAGVSAWTFGRTGDCDLWFDGTVLHFPLAGRPDWLDIHELQLRGAHNAQNVMAASLASWKLGVDADTIAAAARAFAPLAHRLEPVPSRHPALWINDSKATNADAGLQAVLSVVPSGRLILIAGGEAKGPEFGELPTRLKERGARAILFGKDAGVIHSAIGDHVPCTLCTTLDEAVQLAAADTGAGDTVLFSPLCASFDQYRNYEERGAHFRRLAGDL
jgi:UDP-N-acetylmuramoylalanine--D-glutamate ligase